MAKEKVAKIGYKCTDCGRFEEVKEENKRVEPSIQDCPDCGASLIKRGIFVSKVENQ